MVQNLYKHTGEKKGVDSQKNLLTLAANFSDDKLIHFVTLHELSIQCSVVVSSELHVRLYIPFHHSHGVCPLQSRHSPNCSLWT